METWESVLLSGQLKGLRKVLQTAHFLLLQLQSPEKYKQKPKNIPFSKTQARKIKIYRAYKTFLLHILRFKQCWSTFQPHFLLKKNTHFSLLFVETLPVTSVRHKVDPLHKLQFLNFSTSFRASLYILSSTVSFWVFISRTRKILVEVNFVKVQLNTPYTLMPKITILFKEFAFHLFLKRQIVGNPLLNFGTFKKFYSSRFPLNSKKSSHIKIYTIVQTVNVYAYLHTFKPRITPPFEAHLVDLSLVQNFPKPPLNNNPRPLF